MPCDPDTHRPYYYEPTDANGFGSVDPRASYFGFRVMTKLRNQKDTAIRVAGCEPSGCGITLQSEDSPNYGVATGTKISPPGFMPSTQ